MRFTDKQAPTWALVPLKSPERAKSRLAAVLDVEQRSRLFFTLAQRVIQALRSTQSVDAVVVVTSSTDVASFAESLGAIPLLQTADFGMSAAFDAAIQAFASVQPRRVLMMPGDLPLVTATEVESLLQRAASDHGVVIVPDRHRIGTNTLVCTPPVAITPCFGGHSFARHLAAAEAAGVAAQVVDIASLGLDLDCADDLDALRSHGGALAESLFAALHNAQDERLHQHAAAVG